MCQLAQAGLIGDQVVDSVELCSRAGSTGVTVDLMAEQHDQAGIIGQMASHVID